MTDVLRPLIPAMWLLWLAYWVMAGRNQKVTLSQKAHGRGSAITVR